jgi:hypothetical protein
VQAAGARVGIRRGIWLFAVCPVLIGLGAEFRYKSTIVFFGAQAAFSRALKEMLLANRR